MASLSTVYGISILLASIAGIGSAFLANKFVPMIPQPAEVNEYSVQEPASPPPPEVPDKESFSTPPPLKLQNDVPSVPGAPVEEDPTFGGSKQAITIS